MGLEFGVGIYTEPSFVQLSDIESLCDCDDCYSTLCVVGVCIKFALLSFVFYMDLKPIYILSFIFSNCLLIPTWFGMGL